MKVTKARGSGRGKNAHHTSCIAAADLSLGWASVAVLLLLLLASAVHGASQDSCQGNKDKAQPDAACANGWLDGFAIASPEFIGPESALQDGLTGSIPWEQQHGRNRILREPEGDSDKMRLQQQEKINEAVAREDYQTAHLLKQKMMSSGTRVSTTVWEGPKGTGPATDGSHHGTDAVSMAEQLQKVAMNAWSAGPATDGSHHRTNGVSMAEQLQKVARNAWSGIVSGVNQTYAVDLAAAERLVVSILRRAAELGSRRVRIRPIQTPSERFVDSCGHRIQSDICRTFAVEDWHKDVFNWLNLDDQSDGQTMHGAACFAARQESDPQRREILRKICANGDIPQFESISGRTQGNQGSLFRIHLHQDETQSSYHEWERTYSVSSTADFCQVAAGTYQQHAQHDSTTHHAWCERWRDHESAVPGGQIVHPRQCLHNMTRLVLTELSGIFQPFPWVYGKNAGMIHTMQALERKWNTTLSRLSDGLMLAHKREEDYGHARKMVSARHTHNVPKKVPNFMGPIGPDQPPALPWDLSRYDMLLDIADKQLEDGFLSEASHRRVSEHLVLAGRFHRAHATFETALQPEWVDSLHKVLDHELAHKILLYRLRRSGFNASIEYFSITYQRRDQGRRPPDDVKGSLFVDLHDPLPLNMSADVAAEMAEFVGADLT